jgi:hypothetical protein
MGWWSATIMGGDAPLDWQGSICGVLGVEFNYITGKYGYTRARLEKNMTKILAKIAKDKYDAYIGYQVLGVMVLETGAKISKVTRDKILAAAEADVWAKEGDKARQKYIAEFVEAIKAHKPGTLKKLPYQGLLSSLGKAAI